jgi:hypothetical protein
MQLDWYGVAFLGRYAHPAFNTIANKSAPERSSNALK